MQDVNDHHWIARSIALATKAYEVNEVPVGAVLVDANQQVLAEAYNTPIKDNDPTAHAEVLCLRKAGHALHNYRLPHTTLYVSLEPCPMCAGAIIHARVSRVVYAAKDFKSGACGSVMSLQNHAALNHSFTAEFIENQESAKLLKKFFKERRH